MSDTKKLLEEAGVLVPGHFVFVSGVHADTYVNKTAAFVLASHGIAHARAIGTHFKNHQIEAVVAPELGAIPLMVDVGTYLYLETGIDVARVMATKIPNTNPPAFTIGREQGRFLKGKRILVIEDIFTKGGSAKSTVEAVREQGGNVVAVAGLWNRGGEASAESIGVLEFYPLIDEKLPDYLPDECPLCKESVPVNTNLGKGGLFLLTKRARALRLTAAKK